MVSRMTKILIVDDDVELSDVVACWLQGERYVVEQVGTCAQALSFLKTYSYDVILLDWELPDGEGIDLCRNLPERNRQTPVLFLTGRGTADSVARGLDCGAEDYLTKPFELKELSARIRVLLRRKSAAPNLSITAGVFELDPVKHVIYKRGLPLELPRMEFVLLEFFLRNPGVVFSADALLDRVWSSESERAADNIRNIIKNIRRKIDDEGSKSVISTIYGVGYRFDGCPLRQSVSFQLRLRRKDFFGPLAFFFGMAKSELVKLQVQYNCAVVSDCRPKPTERRLLLRSTFTTKENPHA